jgi:tRNA 2-thiouridine synthesizing protein A
MICPRKPHSRHHSANAPIRRYPGDPRSSSPSGRSSCGGHITHLALGTVIHLIASGPAVPTGLAAWCHLTGHAYLGPVREPPSAPRIRAAHQRCLPPDPTALAVTADPAGQQAKPGPSRGMSRGTG